MRSAMTAAELGEYLKGQHPRILNGISQVLAEEGMASPEEKEEEEEADNAELEPKGAVPLAATATPAELTPMPSRSVPRPNAESPPAD